MNNSKFEGDPIGHKGKLSPIACVTCIHWSRDTPTVCDAFPKGIPSVILGGVDRHTKPVLGDGGIIFTPKGT